MQFQFHIRSIHHFPGIPENGRHPAPVIGYRAGIIQIFESMVGQADDRGSELSGGQKPACRVDQAPPCQEGWRIGGVYEDIPMNDHGAYVVKDDQFVGTVALPFNHASMILSMSPGLAKGDLHGGQRNQNWDIEDRNRVRADRFGHADCRLREPGYAAS